MYDQEEIREMLHDIDEHAEGLNEWEVGFVSDLIDKNVKKFTEKQSEKISQIYNKKF